MTTPKVASLDTSTPDDATARTPTDTDKHDRHHLPKATRKRLYINEPAHLMPELDDDEYINYLEREDGMPGKDHPVRKPHGKWPCNGSSIYHFLEPSTTGWWYNLPTPKAGSGPQLAIDNILPHPYEINHTPRSKQPGLDKAMMPPHVRGEGGRAPLTQTAPSRQRTTRGNEHRRREQDEPRSPTTHKSNASVDSNPPNGRKKCGCRVAKLLNATCVSLEGVDPMTGLCPSCSGDCTCECFRCTSPCRTYSTCTCTVALDKGMVCGYSLPRFDPDRPNDFTNSTKCPSCGPSCLCLCPACDSPMETDVRTRHGHDNTNQGQWSNTPHNGSEMHIGQSNPTGKAPCHESMQHRRSARDDKEMHTAEVPSDHGAYSSHGTGGNACARASDLNHHLPSALACMSYAIVDTGASTHLENSPAGFTTRKSTCATVSTGLSPRSPCDFEGTHEQYMLGVAPTYEIIRFRRPDVLCHNTFKRALFSVRAAWEESRINARFEDVYMLILDDGRRIPFYELHNTYILPRWTSLAEAESARAVLLSPRRSVPHGNSTTHDDWVLAALRQERVYPYDAVKQFMRDEESNARHHDHQPHHTLDTTTSDVIRLYHNRFGHLSPKAMLQLPNAVLGADDIRGMSREQVERVVGASCDTCPQARMTRRPHPKQAARKYSTTDPIRNFGDCVSTDHAGPLPPSFVGGYRYLTVFVDHFTSLLAAYFQRSKGLDDSISVRERYISDHAVYGRIKRFHSDSAAEFIGQSMQETMHQHGCGVTHNVPGESDLNNRAEAAINIIFSMARAMRLHSDVPKAHWPALALYATYIRNRVPLRSRKDGTHTTRLALARGQKHTIAEIRVFGCVCHGLLQHKDREDKLSPVAKTGIFMGFPR